jgi:polygalacturonase
MTALLGIALCACVCFASHGDVVISITDVGGVGDGKTSNTASFVGAVAKLAETGGTLKVPAGVFLTGPFNLTSHMTLLVEDGGTILGSTNLSEWPLMPPMPSYGQGRDHPGPRHVSLIHGFNLTDVVVTGNGTIDGNGAFWWDRHNKKVHSSPYSGALSDSSAFVQRWKCTLVDT